MLTCIFWNISKRLEMIKITSVLMKLTMYLPEKRKRNQIKLKELNTSNNCKINMGCCFKSKLSGKNCTRQADTAVNCRNELYL